MGTNTTITPAVLCTRDAKATRQHGKAEHRARRKSSSGRLTCAIVLEAAAPSKRTAGSRALEPCERFCQAYGGLRSHRWRQQPAARKEQKASLESLTATEKELKVVSMRRWPVWMVTDDEAVRARVADWPVPVASNRKVRSGRSRLSDSKDQDQRGYKARAREQQHTVGEGGLCSTSLGQNRPADMAFCQVCSFERSLYRSKSRKSSDLPKFVRKVCRPFYKL